MLHTADNTRVILHLDFDCYYCQVEQKRLGIPRETPCAVQQWEGLIAVNYAARAKGITRHMRVAEAKQKCPEIRLVHVETIGAEGEGSERDGEEEDPSRLQHNRLTQKASLERYRRSTAEVLGLLHRLAPKAVVEKASIDEVYMDVTAMVDQELQALGDGTAPPSALDAFGWGSIVVGGPLDVGSEFERRLAKGAEIACRLRGALLSTVGYTSSAGIACNKLLAKVGSAMHKPNQQTVIPPRGVQEVMRELPLKKLKNFGGKLGAELEELGCSTAGEVQDLPHATLVSRFGGERAAAIAQAVRGVSFEAVQERERPKSMLAAKSFNPTSDLAALGRWFTVLAEELAGRMATDEVQYRRRPRSLVVHYRSGNHPGGAGAERSKSCAMPRFGPEGPSADTLSQAALALFKTRCLQEALPCNRLAISASDFKDLPSPSAHSAITRFLVHKPAPAPTPPEHPNTSHQVATMQPGGVEGVRPQAHAAHQQHAQQGRSLPQQAQQGRSLPQHAQQGRSLPQQAQQRAQGAAQQHATRPAITALFDRATKRQRVGAAAAGGDAQQAQQAAPPAMSLPPSSPQALPEGGVGYDAPPSEGGEGNLPRLGEERGISPSQQAQHAQRHRQAVQSTQRAQQQAGSEHAEHQGVDEAAGAAAEGQRTQQAQQAQQQRRHHCPGHYQCVPPAAAAASNPSSSNPPTEAAEEGPMPTARAGQLLKAPPPSGHMCHAGTPSEGEALLGAAAGTVGGISRRWRGAGPSLRGLTFSSKPAS